VDPCKGFWSEVHNSVAKNWTQVAFIIGYYVLGDYFFIGQTGGHLLASFLNGFAVYRVQVGSANRICSHRK